MATETYKYFKFDPNLRAEYGGGAAQANGDSNEISPRELTHRYVIKKLGLPLNGTRYLWQVGLATDTFLWARVPDLLYTGISAQLSATELATVQSTAPAGWTKQSTVAIRQPSPNRKTIIYRADSIGAGTLTTTGDSRDTSIPMMINAQAGEIIGWEDTVSFNEGKSKSFLFINMSLGSSSFDNTVTTADPTYAQYPKREHLAFPQRTQTIPMIGSKFLFGLGTNDGAYDLTISSQNMFDRAIAERARFFTENPAFPVHDFGFRTIIRRTEDATLNGRLGGFNSLIRSNQSTYGYYILDTDANNAEFNTATGNTANSTYFNADGIHPKTAGNALIATRDATSFINWLRN